MTNFITHPFAKMNNRSIVKNHENPQTLGKFQDPSPPPPPLPPLPFHVDFIVARPLNEFAFDF